MQGRVSRALARPPYLLLLFLGAGGTMNWIEQHSKIRQVAYHGYTEHNSLWDYGAGLEILEQPSMQTGLS